MNHHTIQIRGRLRRRVSLALAVLFLLVTGCAAHSGEKPSDSTSMPPAPSAAQTQQVQELPYDALYAAHMDFSVELFLKTANEGQNSLVSPASIYFALLLAANGADGQTLTQFGALLGGGADISELNAYAQHVAQDWENSETIKLSLANSIWLREGLQVQEAFLQENQAYHGAEIREVDFTRPNATDAVNSWVKEHTDGLIESIVEEPFPAQTLMFLANTVLFDARWQTKYAEYDIEPMDFYLENGQTTKAELMYAQEQYYLQGDGATGFLKPYIDERYAFMALLPKDGMTVSEYMQTLTGERLTDILTNRLEDAIVHTRTPRFKMSYSLSLAETLKAMGLSDAFSEDQADFSKMCRGVEAPYIDAVLHKTYIEVDQKGVKAAAATGVMVKEGAAQPDEEPVVYVVTLDRPFVYGIIDLVTNTPIFLGVERNPAAQ